MPVLTIDPHRCNRCGQCREICPLRAIALPESGIPFYAEGGAQRCILCGHCEALCPTAALRVDDPLLDPLSPPLPVAPLTARQLADHLRRRRSIRKFRPEPVARETIAALLDVARYAPTGSNSQCVTWLVIHDTAEVRRLTGLVVDWMRSAAAQSDSLSGHFNFDAMLRSCERGNDPICRHAPHLLIAHTDQHAVTGSIDAHIALAHADILAPAFGLGTCWAGFFQFACEQWPPLQAALNLPPGHRPHSALLFGTPAVAFARPPRRNPAALAWR